MALKDAVESSMRVVSLHEAETHLSRLVDEAAGGQPFAIAKAGKSLVKVIALDSPAGTGGSRLGFLSGRIEVPDDFDDMGQSEIELMFGLRD